MLNRFANVVEGLVINKENMLKNTSLFGGIVFSQRVLLELTNKGLSREKAYTLVQKMHLKLLTNLTEILNKTFCLTRWCVSI